MSLPETFVDINFYLFLICSGCCYYRHFFCQASPNKWPKANRMLSSSTYQILQKHFEEPLSLQEQFLYFSISTIFWSLFLKFWYFFNCSFSFPSTPISADTAISIIIPFCFFLSITIRSGRLASIRLSHWIFMSHSTLFSSFSTVPSGAYSYHFSLCSNLFFLQISQWTFFATCPVVFCIHFEPIFDIRMLCVAHVHLFSTQSTQGAFDDLIDVVPHIVCPDYFI